MRAISGTRTLSSNCPWLPAIVIAMSLPITWSATWMTTSGMTGLTLPGMIDEPFWSSGSTISARPARGPEPISARSFAILSSETATVLSAPESSTSASRLPCASKGSAGSEMSRPVSELSFSRTLAANSGMGVEPRAGGGAAERDLPDAAESRANALRSESDLGGVSGELLSERDRDRVHQVRPAGLDEVGELIGLALQGGAQLVQRGEEVGVDLAQRRQVNGGRKDVVRGLPHVDVVVRVGSVARERGDHLVRVHVRRGPGASLEDVDRELVVVFAGGDLVAGLRDPLGEIGIELSELGVRSRAAALIRPSQWITGAGIG